MNVNDLAAALRACAPGLCPVEAGVALLISNGTFLRRDDFTSRFVSHGTSGTTPMAAIDWNAATAALHAGELPCSGGERRILQLSAGLAAGPPPTSGTPSPVSTTATSRDWSHQSCTRRGNDPRTGDEIKTLSCDIARPLEIVHVMPCAQGRGPAILARAVGEQDVRRRGEAGCTATRSRIGKAAPPFFCGKVPLSYESSREGNGRPILEYTSTITGLFIASGNSWLIHANLLSTKPLTAIASSSWWSITPTSGT